MTEMWKIEVGGFFVAWMFSGIPACGCEKWGGGGPPAAATGLSGVLQEGEDGGCGV